MEPIGVATSVIGLISTVEVLISTIQRIANNIRSARKNAENLAARCQTIEKKLKGIGHCHDEAFQSLLDQFNKVFAEVEQFLLKLERKGIFATMERILNSCKYEAKFKDFYSRLDSLIVELNSFQTAYNPSDRIKRVLGVHSRSEVGSHSTSIQSKEAARHDLEQRTQKLQKVNKNKRIRAFRVCLSKLEEGDTSATVQAGQMITNTFGTATFLPMYLVSSRHAVSAIAACQIFCHFSIEFVLSNGAIGTIERCVDGVNLYKGKSSRKPNHGVLIADLVELGIKKTLGDLIMLRNEHQKKPYSVTDNNCKHFAFHAVMNLVGNYFYGENIPFSSIFKDMGSEFTSFRDVLQVNYGKPRFIYVTRDEAEKLKWIEGPMTDDMKTIFQD